MLPDDAAAGNGNNNASYRQVLVSEDDEDVFVLSLDGPTQREQPAIRAWQDVDTSVVETDIQIPGEGLFILAAKATELGGGMWRYSYAFITAASIAPRQGRKPRAPRPIHARSANR